MKIIEKAKEIIKRLWKIVTKPDMLVLPGQLAFFFLLAIVPTLTIIVYITSLFHLSIDFFTNFITKAFGSSTADLILPMVRDINISKAFIITLLITFYTASTGASSIIITSNHLYGVQNTSFIRRKIKAIILILILVILLVFLLLIPTFGDKIIDLIKYVNMNPQVTKTLTILINISKGPIAWLITFFLIKIIYAMAPDVRFPSSCTTKGALFTTVGFGLSTLMYSIFVNNFAHYDILYGGLAHFVVLMIWLYIIAIIVTISLAINKEEVNKWQKKEQ